MADSSNCSRRLNIQDLYTTYGQTPHAEEFSSLEEIRVILNQMGEIKSSFEHSINM